jgi:hypothetical protein
MNRRLRAPPAARRRPHPPRTFVRGDHVEGPPPAAFSSEPDRIPQTGATGALPAGATTSPATLAATARIAHLFISPSRAVDPLPSKTPKQP